MTPFLLAPPHHISMKKRLVNSLPIMWLCLPTASRPCLHYVAGSGLGECWTLRLTFGTDTHHGFTRGTGHSWPVPTATDSMSLIMIAMHVDIHVETVEIVEWLKWSCLYKAVYSCIDSYMEYQAFRREFSRYSPQSNSERATVKSGFGAFTSRVFDPRLRITLMYAKEPSDRRLFILIEHKAR